jgi:hypothetical protein
VTAFGAEDLHEPLPEEVASWLITHGWTKLTTLSDRPALWTLGDSEVLQPTLTTGSDYHLRLEQLLQSLAQLSGDSPAALAEQMLAEGADVIEWRAVGEWGRDDSIPLDDGLLLLQSVRSAFVAAASSSMQRRAYFGHGTLKAARAHARLVRMGQTRRGSYIIPIISRIPGALAHADEAQQTLDLEVTSQPFERRVVVQLAQALARVQNLAVGAGHEPSRRELIESVGDGVSHELCASIDAALSAPSFAAVDVKFTWAPRAGLHPDVRKVEFPRDAQPIVHRMAEALRGSDVIAEQTLSGYVYRITKEPGEDFAEVKIKTSIGKKTRTVTLQLTPEQTHEAHVAHDEERPILVRGRLVREQGRQWFYESLSEFGFAQAAPIEWFHGQAADAEPDV